LFRLFECKWNINLIEEERGKEWQQEGKNKRKEKVMYL
jgi:hypothetical protein